MPPWKKYQEEVADYFRSLGLDATTDTTIQGVRTNHDIDVLVNSHHVGFDITWIVECKKWKTRINKLHVLALREIVSDTGADRGIILSESGFQNGAIEAANLTNVQVTSLDDLKLSASGSINDMRLRELYDRVGICQERYWDIPKELRIEHGIRSEVGVAEYSGARVVEMCFDLLTRAFRGSYPFQSNSIQSFVLFGPEKEFESASEVISVIEEHISILEKKLNDFESKRSHA